MWLCLLLIIAGLGIDEKSHVDSLIRNAAQLPTSESIVRFKEILHTDTIVIDDLNKGMINYLIGSRYSRLSEWDSLIHYELAAIDYFEYSGYNEYRLPRAYRLIGDAYVRLSHIDLAINSYEDAMNLSVSGKDAYDAQNYALINVSQLTRNRTGDYHKCLLYLNHAQSSMDYDSISNAQRAAFHLEKSIVLSNLRREEYLNEAKREIEISDSLHVSEEYTDYHQSLYNTQMAYIHSQMKEYAVAKDFYLRNKQLHNSSTQISNESKIKNLLNLTGICNLTGDFNEGLKYGEDAIRLVDKKGGVSVESKYMINENMSSAYAGMGEFRTAHDHLHIDKGYTANLSKRLILNGLFEKSRLYLQEYDLTKKEVLLDSALKYYVRFDEEFLNCLADQSIQESELKWQDYGSSYYDEFSYMAYSRNDLDLLWSLAEKSKGLLLVKAKRNRLYINPDRAVELKIKIDSIQSYIQNIEFGKNRMNEDFRDQELLDQSQIVHIEYLKELHDLEVNKPLEIVARQELEMGENCMFLQYKYGRNRLYAMTVGADNSSQIYDLMDVAELDSMLNVYATHNQDHDFKSESQYLYRRLIEPIEPIEGLPEQVIIVPEGLLSRLPFETLQSIDGAFLIERVGVSYAISATHWQQQKRKVSGYLSSTLISPNYAKEGNIESYVSIPKGEKDNFKYLAYSKEEINHLEHILNTDALEGDIDKVNFSSTLSHSSIFHFSGHGYQDADDYRFSFLALADQSDELSDVVLSSEIDNMSSSADLVVLNACNTGSGELINGEGVFSLARSFFKAGAQSVVNSLWNIDDQSSSEIIQDFYKNLSSGQNKSEALRNAKLSYINNAPDYRRHPYYWAGLILIGDDSPIEMGDDSYVGTIVGVSALMLFCFFLWKRSPSSINLHSKEN